MILRGVFAIELSLGWRELEEYLNIAEQYLQKAKHDIKDQLDAKIKSLSPELDPEDRDSLDEHYSDIYWNYDQLFPSVLRNYFLVSAYSLLEHKMTFICWYLWKDEELPHSLNDAKGSKLDQFKKHCKEARLPISFTSQEWREIKYFSLIRNCIVHNNGLIKGFRGEQRLRTYALSKNIMSQDLRRQQITLTTEFCKESTKTMW